MEIAVLLTILIVFLIGLIVGIYMREAINLFKRDKPPDDIELIIDWIEGHERK